MSHLTLIFVVKQLYIGLYKMLSYLHLTLHFFSNEKGSVMLELIEFITLSNTKARLLWFDWLSQSFLIGKSH